MTYQINSERQKEILAQENLQQISESIDYSDIQSCCKYYNGQVENKISAWNQIDHNNRRNSILPKIKQSYPNKKYKQNILSLERQESQRKIDQYKTLVQIEFSFDLNANNNQTPQKVRRKMGKSLDQTFKQMKNQNNNVLSIQEIYKRIRQKQNKQFSNQININEQTSNLDLNWEKVLFISQKQQNKKIIYKYDKIQNQIQDDYSPPQLLWMGSRQIQQIRKSSFHPSRYDCLYHKVVNNN